MPKAADVPAHLGEKLAEAIRLRGVSQADVAREFGVKPPTVSKDWLKHGRIAKKHFPRLVEFFQLPYEWWFGEAAPSSGLFDVRRGNLRRLIKEKYNGLRAVAAKEFGLPSAAVLSEYENGEKPIETELARRVETAAAKPLGWIDVPPHKGAQRSVDERVAALPGPLRSYLLGELELCEAVAARIPADFLRAPTSQNVRAFQEYLRSLSNPGPQRKAG